MFRSLSTRLLAGFILVATFPVAAVAILNRWIDERSMLQEAHVALADDALAVRSHLDDHVEFHRVALSLLAGTIHADRGASATEINERLRLARKLYPGFISIAVFDAHGVAVAVQPSVDASGRTLPVVGRSFADRAYIKLALAADTAIMTGVFRGRGIGNAPIVAVARAIRDAQGAALGVVEASLDLASFEGFRRAESSSRNTIVVDRGGAIVFASPGVGVSPLDTLRAAWMRERGWPEDEIAKLRGTLHASDSDARRAGSRASDRKAEGPRSLIASLRTNDGWQIVVERPLATIQALAEARRSALLLAAIAALVLGLVVALLVADQLRAPLRELNAWIAAFDLRSPSAQQAMMSSPPPQEFAALQQTVTTLASRLRTSYFELEHAVAEKETLNVQLNSVLRELDARVASRTAELQEALRIAHEASVTKSRFLANMSHELRTPLNSVIGFSSVLLKNRAGRLTQTELEMMERILANGRHLLTLINDILDISKIEAGHTALDLTECDVVQLVHETLAQLDGQIAVKPIALRYDGPDVPTTLYTDAGKLRQVLINLVGNAVKFTEEGEVVVEMARDRDGRVAELRVRDTGIGIPANRLEAIFQPFEQADTSTSRKFGGTGLGLAISRSLAEMLGARLSVTSAVGKGSLFTLTFVETPRPPRSTESYRRAREAARGFLIS